MNAVAVKLIWAYSLFYFNSCIYLPFVVTHEAEPDNPCPKKHEAIGNNT